MQLELQMVLENLISPREQLLEIHSGTSSLEYWRLKYLSIWKYLLSCNSLRWVSFDYPIHGSSFYYITLCNSRYNLLLMWCSLDMSFILTKGQLSNLELDLSFLKVKLLITIQLSMEQLVINSGTWPLLSKGGITY